MFYSMYLLPVKIPQIESSLSNFPGFLQVYMLDSNAAGSMIK